MKMTDKIAHWLNLAGASLTSIAAILLRSRMLPRKSGNKPSRPMLIMGNGPSLNDLLESQRREMSDYDLMAVNFAANSPVFRELRPAHYILADPHFFESTSDHNVVKLWDSLASADWNITLHVPYQMRRHQRVATWLSQSSIHSLGLFNMTAVEGFPSLCRFMIDKRLAMPRPRNVLIPSIMVAIDMDYDKIVIAGADHSWTKTLSVDADNRVVTVQPHFYTDNDEEKERVTAVYENIRLHEILGSMVVAFRSYHQIADYARRRGVSILNATQGSFIDAFKRIKSI